MQLYKKNVRIFDPMKNKFISDEDVQKNLVLIQAKLLMFKL